jgi:hypothetical protein
LDTSHVDTDSRCQNDPPTPTPPATAEQAPVGKATYTALFDYLDTMSSSVARGCAIFCRQSFIGGATGLLDFSQEKKAICPEGATKPAGGCCKICPITAGIP